MRAEKNNRSGFSLVELAIVLLIIGLIVGGVLKGQDLIQSARVNDVQTTLNQLRAATNTFQDKFVAMPGDMSNGAMVADGMGDGNGNGRIDTGNRYGDVGDDTTLYWAHLAGAGLISGVDGNDINDNGLSESNALEAAVGGVFTMKYESPQPYGAAFSLNVDHWFLLGSGDGNANTDAVLTPVDLRSIDLKGDDGDPSSGDVVAGDSACVTNTNGDGEYATTDAISCTAFFRL